MNDLTEKQRTVIESANELAGKNEDVTPSNIYQNIDDPEMTLSYVYYVLDNYGDMIEPKEKPGLLRRIRGFVSNN